MSLDTMKEYCMTQASYAPPPINQDLLAAAIIDRNGNPENTEAVKEIKDLVWSYANWWVLMLTFPNRNVLCTPAIWDVRRTHAELDRFKFMFDCLNYLGYIPQKTDVMGMEGVRNEYRRILITAESLNELFDEPGMAWIPIQERASKIKSGDIVSLW